MLNQLVIVGRLTSEIEIEGETATIILACPRTFKNSEGIYETDFIPIKISGEIAKRTEEYCHKGDILGIKGIVQSTKGEDGTISLNLVADRVTFLSSKRSDEDEKENSNN